MYFCGMVVGKSIVGYKGRGEKERQRNGLTERERQIIGDICKRRGLKTTIGTRDT
jgi:hypothetical protein